LVLSDRMDGPWLERADGFPEGGYIFAVIDGKQRIETLRDWFGGDLNRRHHGPDHHRGAHREYPRALERREVPPRRAQCPRHDRPPHGRLDVADREDLLEVRPRRGGVPREGAVARRAHRLGP